MNYRLNRNGAEHRLNGRKEGVCIKFFPPLHSKQIPIMGRTGIKWIVFFRLILLMRVATCSQRVYNHENIIHYAVAKCKQLKINIVINAGTMREQKGDICCASHHHAWARPEERKQGSGDLSNGPKTHPTLHSSAMVESRVVSC